MRASELTTSLALENKEVISIQSPIQGCSSTKIRKYLKLHPELYQVNDTSSLENTPLNTLDRRVLNYILTSTQKPYYRSKEQHVRRVKEKVKEYVSSHIFKNEMMQLVCLNDIGEGGKSGNLTFKVTSEREKYFIKAFVNSEHLRDFANELGGIRLLNSLSLSSCRAVDSVCWEQSKSGYSHAGLPYVEKKDLAKIFKALHCQQSEDVSGNEALIEMCFYMGQALSEFHHCRSYPVQSYRLKEETQKINQRAQSCLDQIPNNDERLKLREAFFDSYNQFLEQPGVHTYAHGDANASNFIVDLEAKKVTFIDLDRFFSMRTKEGDPLGFPGEDYHRFYQGLSWLNHFYPIASSTLQSAKEAFERGYHHRFNSLITIQAHTYFSAYWKLRVLSVQQSG